ncbi:hypothetical protein QTL95_10265 [Rhizobium sp. S152]|uniref:hypothetical protein n=1 Tax=Rhizobium sp. S152 TaxID=3055038 RepID=UPI0025A9AFAC|nr:hypothetical protein [Rhizobium sp. S152]MDM9626282.1 hypothetical protein [Rhizobium sp. S152]
MINNRLIDKVAPVAATAVARQTTLPAQSKLHKYAISGVPTGERVHTKVHPTIDLRRKLAASLQLSRSAPIEKVRMEENA